MLQHPAKHRLQRQCNPARTSAIIADAAFAAALAGEFTHTHTHYLFLYLSLSLFLSFRLSLSLSLFLSLSLSLSRYLDV